jgi:exocyst complex component 4
MLDTLKDGKPMFAFDEYNTLLELQCTGESSSELNSFRIDLHAISMSMEGWEVGGQ